MQNKIINKLIFSLFILALQIFIFNHINIYGYAIPMVFIYVITKFSLDTRRSTILVWAFLIGLCQDLFANTIGITAASLTAMALVQPIIFQKCAIISKEDFDKEPSAKIMKWTKFSTYIFVLVLIQQTLFYLIEAFTFFNFLNTALNIISGTAITTLFILLFESIGLTLSKKQK